MHHIGGIIEQSDYIPDAIKSPDVNFDGAIVYASDAMQPVCCMCGKDAPHHRVNKQSPNKPQPAIHKVTVRGHVLTIKTIEQDAAGVVSNHDLCRECAVIRANEIASWFGW